MAGRSSSFREHPADVLGNPVVPAPLPGAVAISLMVACQWATCLAIYLAMQWFFSGAWGAWLPMIGIFLGTAIYGWTFAPVDMLRARRSIRLLSVRAGCVNGVTLGLLLHMAYQVGSIQPADGAMPWVLVPVIGGVGVGVVAMMLTLTGLDLSRTGHLTRPERASRPSEVSNHGL